MTDKTYSFYGKILNVKNDNQLKYIADFFKSIGNKDEISNNIAKIIINKLVKKFLLATKMDSAWLTIRTSTANNYFDIPRWHCDGYYYNAEKMHKNKEFAYKFVMTLKGPGTIFKSDEKAKIKMNQIDNEMINELGTQISKIDPLDIKKINKTNNLIHEEFRKKTMEELLKFPTIQSNNNQGIIFISGNKKRCLVHSEPPVHEDRLFISIVPGHYEDIIDMTKFRNSKMNTPIYE